SRGAAGSLFVWRQDSIGAIPLGHVNRAIPGIASRETILHPLFSLITWFARWPCCTMQTICDCHLAGPLIARPTNPAQTWSVTSMLLNPRLLAFLAAMAGIARLVHAQEPTSGKVRCQVVDAESGNRIPARIYIQGDDGAWHFPVSQGGTAITYRKSRPDNP